MSKVAEVSTFTNTNSLVAESLKCSRNRFSGKTLPCGNNLLTNIFFFFFAFNAVASPDNISLQAGRVRPEVGGGGVKAKLIFFARGAGGGQNKFEQKSRGSRQNIIIFFRMGG